MPDDDALARAREVAEEIATWAVETYDVVHHPQPFEAIVQYADERIAGALRAYGAARERGLEQTIRDLMSACETLMDEVTGKRAAKWGIVNDAMVAGTKATEASRARRAPVHAYGDARERARAEDAEIREAAEIVTAAWLAEICGGLIDEKLKLKLKLLGDAIGTLAEALREPLRRASPPPDRPGIDNHGRLA